ncbi:oxidative stress defense protein [Photobacterium phosphoreum]|uniref:oxidative stress defense protein n=1 Tax=Photobacterium phosphoreum TaxID=659 RepID=UPI000D1742B7|nr:oxidative stress defense protein [Photobacterium phosphoreum]PSU74442.1 oxidative stress defense protein [Photobacterium phosphoreum]PSW13714.1 oxidative stress defense protein [Photobacterium phosphoreum]
MKKKCLAMMVLGASAFVSTAAMAADIPFPHLETTGRGEVVVKPDMAVFSVNVVETKKTAVDAKLAVDQAVTKFIERLQAAGVNKKDINSANISLSAQYNYPKDHQPELVGFRANRNVEVTVHQLTQLNTYLDDALGNGINQINNIDLKVADTEKYQRQARQKAIENAKQVAASLAQGFGNKIEGVWQIDYNTNSQPMPYRRSNDVVMYSSMNKGAIDQSYTDNNIVIKDSVNVIFKLAEK